MDKATLIGLIVGISAVVISILLGGSLITFFNLPSIFVVVGGTLAAMLINFPLKNIIDISKVVKNTFFEKDKPMKDNIDLLIQLSEKARREGILAIEKALEDIDDVFLKGGLRLAVDGSEPEAIKDAMEIELENISRRHSRGQQVLDAGGTFAPAFGLVGTLIGLVNMLKNMSDPSSIGPSMAVALLTTLYGAILSNLLFLPLKGKLEQRSAMESITKDMMIEGVIGIQSGDNPRMLRTKLETFLPPDQRSKGEESNG